MTTGVDSLIGGNGAGERTLESACARSTAYKHSSPTRPWAASSQAPGFPEEYESEDVARKWLQGVLETIGPLSAMPGRCSLAPEAADVGCPVRMLPHGRRDRAFQIFFLIVESKADPSIWEPLSLIDCSAGLHLGLHLCSHKLKQVLKRRMIEI